MRRILVSGVLVLIGLAAVAAPASAHDCFNAKKTVGAGSKTLVVLDSNGNEASVETTGNGNGGFVTIDANALVPGVVIDIHTFGNHGPKDGVAGPGAEKAGAKGCDGKGIDYVEACFGPE